MRLRLAQIVGSEPALHYAPFDGLACRVLLRHIDWHSLSVHRALLNNLVAQVAIATSDLALFKLGSHGHIIQDSLTLVTHYHHVVAEGVNGPARVHLDHCQEVIDNHAVADIYCVDVSALLQNKGHVSPVRMEHDIDDGATDHVASLGRSLQIGVLTNGTACG